MKTYKQTRSARYGAWSAFLIVLAVIAFAMLTSSCQSETRQRVENQVAERCVVIDSYQTVGLEYDKLWLKVIRLSDNTIHGKQILWSQKSLYEINDTIIVQFDRRYDYQSEQRYVQRSN